MTFDPAEHHRRTIRIPGYDYSLPGGYYVTIVIHGREHLLGKIVDGNMKLDRFGRIVHNTWFDLPGHYPHIELDAFVIMPNHVHGIIFLNENRRGGSLDEGDGGRNDPNWASKSHAPQPQTRPYTPHPLSEIVRAFKSFSARRINLLRRTTSQPVWQRNYYEHVIRDNTDYMSKRDYILNNPSNWDTDEEK